MNPYEVLGVDRLASNEEIKRAWRQRASKQHPDRDGGDHDTMAEVNMAYAVLSNPEKRSIFDATGHLLHEDDDDKLAGSLLVQAFNALLDAEDDSNLLGLVRNGLEHAISNIESQRARASKDIARLNERKGKVRVRAAGRTDNLFEGLCLQRIDAIEKHLAGLDLHERVHRKALKMLDDYECDVTIPTNRYMFDVQRFPWSST